MCSSRVPGLFCSAAAALGLGLAVAPLAHAQFTVFDPSNYAQNVLTAARTLESVNNQIRSLQNEAEMLIGQARSLANLPFSSLAALQAQPTWDAVSCQAELVGWPRPGMEQYVAWQNPRDADTDCLYAD